jgi:hypothetical protein
MQMSHRNSERIYLVDSAFKKCAKINDNSNNRSLAPQTTAIANGLRDLSAAAFLTRVLMTWRRLITPAALTSLRVSWRRPIMQMRERAEGSTRLRRPRDLFAAAYLRRRRFLGAQIKIFE